MPAERTGTASQVNIAASSGSTSVTVPADAEMVVATVGWYNGGSDLGTLTLNSVQFTVQQEVDAGATTHGLQLATLLAPATGSQTLAWAWDLGDAPGEGGALVLTYVKNIHPTTPIRDSGSAVGEDVNNVEVTIDSEATDLIIAHVHNPTGGASPVLAGTVYVDDWQINNAWADTSQITATSPSTTVTMTGEYYSAMSAVSIVAAEIGGDITPRVIRRSRRTFW